MGRAKDYSMQAGADKVEFNWGDRMIKMVASKNRKRFQTESMVSSRACRDAESG